MGDYLKPEPDDPEKCVHVLVFLLVWGHISVQTLICPHKSLKCQLWFLFEFSGSECEVLWSGETAVCVWCRHNEHPSWTRSLIYEVCRTTSCFLWIKRTHMNTCVSVCVCVCSLLKLIQMFQGDASWSGCDQGPCKPTLRFKSHLITLFNVCHLLNYHRVLWPMTDSQVGDAPGVTCWTCPTS